MSQTIERRTFIKTSATAAAALATQNARARIKGANDRINIGIIGAGERNQGGLMPQIQKFSKAQNVAITAVCDVWKANRQSAAAKAKKWFGKDPMVTSRFEEILASKDVDAVTIATPDFWHSPILIKAVRAGKDVYCEKPMSNTLDEAKEALKATEETKRIVQVGTQRRSDGKHIEAREFMKNNPIGKVTRFQAEFNFNHNRWARSYDNCKKQDVDWEAYLMKDKSRPFDARMLRQWHLYKEFTTGLSGLWMVHLVDACQMIMRQEFPATSDCAGGTWVWTQGREHCDTFSALLTYPAGFLFNFAMSLGNSAGGRYAIYGTDGTFDLNTWRITGDGGGAKKVKEPRTINGAGGTDHMLNWLECLRSRKQPNASIRAGYSHAVACLMTAQALWTGRRKTYDPKTMQIRDA